MELIRCSKGHFYNSAENSTCPVCAAENSGSNRMLENILATEAFAASENTHQENGPQPTEPVNSDNGNVQKYNQTVSANYANTRTENLVDPLKRTEPVPIVKGSQNKEAPGFNPVVGWLVCIDGPSKGSDYRIRSQYNFIGRSSQMDICIPEDPHISAERSAVIAYDDIERAFFFGPGSGHNAVRINGQMILSSAPIKAYDVLTVGLTKLLFIPLCGDRFDWNET